jgi:hypothetical protein
MFQFRIHGDLGIKNTSKDFVGFCYYAEHIFGGRFKDKPENYDNFIK